jgi:cytochrome c5
LPGERAAIYQPDPELPERVSVLEFSPDDITNLNPAAHDAIANFVKTGTWGRFQPCVEGKPNIYSNIDGGGEWVGASVDPGGRLYVSVTQRPWDITVHRVAVSDNPTTPDGIAGQKIFLANCAVCHHADRGGNGFAPSLIGLGDRLKQADVALILHHGLGGMPKQPQLSDDDIDKLCAFLLAKSAANAPVQWTFDGYQHLQDPQNYPGGKPPWGKLVCLDLNSGRIAWQVPVGEYPELTARGIPKTGTPVMGGPATTSTGLVFLSGTQDPTIGAYDTDTGAELWSGRLPNTGSAPPIIYQCHGHEYVALAACGGGKVGGPTGDAWVAFALPEAGVHPAESNIPPAVQGGALLDAYLDELAARLSLTPDEKAAIKAVYLSDGAARSSSSAASMPSSNSSTKKSTPSFATSIAATSSTSSRPTIASSSSTSPPRAASPSPRPSRPPSPRRIRMAAPGEISEHGRVKPFSVDRILEIGFTPLIATNPAYKTTYVETRVAALPGQGLIGKLRGAWAQARRLISAALDRRHNLVVCRSFNRFVWRPNFSFLTNVSRYGIYWLIRFCIWLRVKRGRALLVVLDWDDEAFVFPRDMFLLEQCAIFFKRELPQNSWNAFKYLQPPHQETMDFAQDPRFVPLVEKLRPVPLGIATEKIERVQRCLPPGGATLKSADIFFAGRLNYSSVRIDGMREIKALAANGVRLDIPGENLPFEEFVLRMSRAWLVWSPEGGGWDCFRHSEICVAGSVPLINYPTIQRHEPLLDGIHCCFYDVDPGGLTRAVLSALADKPQLERMAAAGKAHILKHHSYPQIAAYILESTLALQGVFSADASTRDV